LSKEAVRAVLAPRHLPMKAMVMPALVARADQMDGVDPLAPCFPMNAARIASRLARKPMGVRWAAVLRPCEIRAFVELVKLKQARTDEVILISVDCLGAFQNKDYIRFAGADPPASTVEFVRRTLAGESLQPELAPACRACEFPVPPQADVHIGLFGGDAEGALPVEARSAAGRELVDALGLAPVEAPAARQAAVDAFVARRLAYRDEMFSRTLAAIDGLDKAAAYFANCINCYNCRVACPVCYCKECVFVTDVFNHEPAQYLEWAGRQGALKMPTDTLFYHLTRLAHMSTACVGCGQCSNACPNDIPVMEVFRTVARHTQQAFGYEAGRNLEEAPPLSVFKESEFPEVVGISRRSAAG
ncbi:MAG TPA: Coenzyme F420 hydrogenase/dehydrogenase, beta subunit C-terminal domain, partial [Desulfobacterales bacterium]|nr:Coenzyme F420 hydrogenase/dehydrogenase, beta subunit C-terminal domain [Desulfobacterales bacterium]